MKIRIRKKIKSKIKIRSDESSCTPVAAATGFGRELSRAVGHPTPQPYFTDETPVPQRKKKLTAKRAEAVRTITAPVPTLGR